MPPQRPSAPRTPASKHSRELKPARRVVWIRNPLDILADAVDILDRTSPPRVEGRGIPCDVPAERRRPRYHDLPFTPPSSTHATQRPRIVASDTTSRLSKRLHHTTLAPLSPVAAHLQPTRLLRSPEIHVNDPHHLQPEGAVYSSFCDEMGGLQLRCSNHCTSLPTAGRNSGLVDQRELGGRPSCSLPHPYTSTSGPYPSPPPCSPELTRGTSVNQDKATCPRAQDIKTVHGEQIRYTMGIREPDWETEESRRGYR